MNKIRMSTMIVCRMFSKKLTKPSRLTKSKRPTTITTPLAGVRGKLKLTENEEDAENFDSEDLSEFESDFMNVGMSHRMHEWEMRQKKEHLKQQITVQKCFKETEPRFLTFAETELIRKLYETNPEEWTIEKLSESFPALPQTIQKILRSKWLPKSVEKAIQYDNVAIENWKKFHAGQLAVDVTFREHLMKFKNRKIIPSNRESLVKQFVVPKPEFKKPKSQLFLNIVQSCLTKDQNDKKLLPQRDASNQLSTEHSDQPSSSTNVRSEFAESETNLSFAIVKDSEKFTSSEKQYPADNILESQANSEKYNLILSNQKKNQNRKALTFNEFVKANLEKIHKKSPQEGALLLEVYKKQLETTETDNTVINAEKTQSLETVQKSDKSAITKNKNAFHIISSTKDDMLDTYIKVRNKKVDMELEYVKPIKISKQLFKRGMTYRISDCYYDDDGEFLYRVPGVQN